MRRIIVAAGLAAVLAGAPVALARPDHGGGGKATDATYFNDAAFPAADPYVLEDADGSYYAYSTDGADDGSHFGIYKSADLATWQHVDGGALRVDDPKQWGNDWFWAPEVYRNPRTGLYFMFYAARSDANKQNWFGFADFEEPCKIGVAVSRSPKGPFKNIASAPIDYNPYDPDYHDVNQIMGPDQKVPPATRELGETAPLGTYLPAIDPDVYFAPDGRIYLYYSRNAYRNWNWDDDLGKYVEESNIYAVELTADWWNDPTGRTMPSVAPRYLGANDGPGGPPGPARRDGFTKILDYGSDKQAWENADVDDYALTGGEKKNRRWEEGSSLLRVKVRGRDVYYLTYSANNWETPQYGVGYATASSPLGPFRKAASNPILSQTAGMFSTGHGSFASSPDGSELYYVHHARPTAEEPQRRLYTSRATLDRRAPDAAGNPTLRIDATTSDRPIPSGVAPYSIRASRRALRVREGDGRALRWRVESAAGVRLALQNPQNRVRASVADPAVASVVGVDGGRGVVVGGARGATTVTLTYQRRSSSGGWYDVTDGGGPVATTVRIRVR